jgi:hypothetical protein
MPGKEKKVCVSTAAGSRGEGPNDPRRLLLVKCEENTSSCLITLIPLNELLAVSC